MHINNNLNSLMQLEKKLEESTKELARLNQSGGQTSNKQKNIKQDLSNNENKENESSSQEKTEQYEQKGQIPLAYSVDHNKISVQSSAQQTVLDIVV